MSHAAVVAREFGIPAVVDTAEATRRMADGMVLEVDGATGVVTVIS
jgi:phosphohistidine swiveling domain-containing protein